MCVCGGGGGGGGASLLSHIPVMALVVDTSIETNYLLFL